MPDRILIVEDEPTLALLLSESLRAEGFATDVLERGDAVVPHVKADWSVDRAFEQIVGKGHGR